MTEDALARRQTLSDLVATYRQAEDKIRRGFALIAEAERAIGASFSSDRGSVRIMGRYNMRPNFDDPDESLHRIKREVWARLVERMGVRAFMSVDAAKQLDAQLESDELPEISEDSIVTMLRGFEAQAEHMLTAAVQEAFETLRPRSMSAKRYKRNSELEVPERVALTGLVEPGFSGGLRVRYYWEQHLIAIENVLHGLQGKGTMLRTPRSALSHAIAKSSVGETDLFQYRAYKNGSLHLRFLDTDLLARFNARAGGKRLRPGT